MGQFCCNTCRNTIFLLVILFASCLSQDVRGNEGTCSRPAAVANANLRSKYRNTEEFTEGSEVEYDCNIGYSITGRSRNRKCLKSGNWSSVEFECELIRCTYLPHPDNGRRTDANNGAGETTRFSCNPGYTLKGPSQLICRTDGEWSPRYTPKCEPILCPELLAPRNGDIFQDTSDGVRNNYESIVQYTCNYGYTINGTKSRTINRRCEADGTWDGYNYFCDTLKCEHIEFYGGTLNYFGSTHRAEGTYVYYSCHEGYTMFPSGVDYSECMRTSLRWKPDPPKCHGNCRLQDYQPIDKSLVRQQKDGERKNVELADSVDIIHGEKIIFSCKNPSSYELCVRPNDQVLCTDDTLSDNFDITCTNGTFDKVNKDTRISCQERRCDVTSHMATQTHACYWKDDDQDGQCRQYGFKVDSQSSINIKCDKGYELQETLSSRYQNVVSSKMKCIKGKFSTVYSCSPKRCDVSNLPYNENTIRKNKNTILRQHRPFSPITPIDHDTEITYNCKDGGYELYVNSSDTFLSEFTSKCSYGQLSVSKERFPICIERRCDVTSHMARQTNSCYWKDDQYGQCRRNSFKVDSQSSINIECNKGYEFYETKRRSYQTLVQKMECIKGHFSTEYSCLPQRCVLTDLPMNEFTLRTPGGSHIEHGQSINYTCKKPEDYELYVQNSNEYRVSFSATCNFGNISRSPREFPLCVEKHCEFRPRNGVCYHRGEQCHNRRFYLKSQESIQIKCTNGSKLVRESEDKDVETATIKCMKGKPEEDIKCVPESELEKLKEHVVEFGGKVFAKASKFFCRFSIFQLIACSDFCLPDKIENGVVTDTDTLEVLKEVKNGLQVNTQCNEGYDRVGRSDNTCENGEWKYSFPQCNPKQCNLTLNGKEIILYNDRRIIKQIGTVEVFKNGSNVQIRCANGYTLRSITVTDVYDENDTEWMTCVLGSWTNRHTCTPKQCKVPEVKHASVKPPTDQFVSHSKQAKFKCEENYHFEQKFPKVNGTTTVSELVTTCSLGNWSQTIPLQCNPDGCNFTVHEGSHYFITNDNLREANVISHNTDVTTNCSDGYDLFKKDDGSLVNYTHSTVTCRFGSWQNIHLCRKRCKRLEGNTTSYYKHNETSVCKLFGNVTCVNGNWTRVNTRLRPFEECLEIKKQDHSIETATNMTLQNTPTSTEQLPEIKEQDHSIETLTDMTLQNIPTSTEQLPEKDGNNETTSTESDAEVITDVTMANISHPIEQPLDCEIPMDSAYEYKTVGDGEIIQQGSFVTHGTVLNVTCIYVYYGDDDHQTVQCINGRLETANISCPNETPVEETFSCDLKLNNGEVQRPSKRQYEEYYLEVSCNEGYKLNLIQPDKPYCKCNKTEIVCTYGGQTPECLPEKCTISEYDSSRLKVYVLINGSAVDLSRGIVIKHGEAVFFKCINSETEYFEPSDRSFKCMKGKWLEKPKVTDEEWLNINSSYFPVCRKAICVPLCENGGKCVRDDTCECQHQSTGRRCETVECDPECEKNGGKCTAPGICGLCPDGKSGNNCQRQGCSRPVNVPTITHPKDIYTLGETIDSSHFACPPNHVLLPRNGMQCLAGVWTAPAECKPNIHYVIQIRTGPDEDAGTHAGVYVYLHGEKGSTDKLFIRGSYGQGLLDEQTIKALDVTPIKMVTVGKDSKYNDWQVNYVSIFINSAEKKTRHDEFYFFDASNTWIDSLSPINLKPSRSPDQCVHTFQRQNGLLPNYKVMKTTNYFNLGRGDTVSERTCKQMCVVLKERRCNGVYYYERYRDCFGFEETDDPGFIAGNNTNFFKKMCLK